MTNEIYKKYLSVCNEHEQNLSSIKKKLKFLISMEKMNELIAFLPENWEEISTIELIDDWKEVETRFKNHYETAPIDGKVSITKYKHILGTVSRQSHTKGFIDLHLKKDYKNNPDGTSLKTNNYLTTISNPVYHVDYKLIWAEQINTASDKITICIYKPPYEVFNNINIINRYMKENNLTN